MPSRDDISAGLPAPRDDEPRELRGDITDELADHLACSMAGERLRDDDRRGRSEEELLGEVLGRFGDPAQVARRLWWDAMKGKIMAQRLMMGVTLVAAAAAIVAVVLLIQLVASNREAQQQLLGAQREWMQAMIAEVRTARDKDAEQSGEWNSLIVKMIDENDRPVQGDVKCQGTPLGNQHLIAESHGTDTDGVADFGRFPPGFYQIFARVEATNESTQTTVLLGPGRPMEMTIRCPTELDAPVPARFEISPPSTILAPLYFVAVLSRRGRDVDGTWWNADKEESVALLLDFHGAVLGRLPHDLIQGDKNLAAFQAGINSFAPQNNQFPVAISPAVALTDAAKIIPSSYQITLAAYIGDAPTDEEQSERPNLKRLGSWALGIEHEFAAATAPCGLGTYEDRFWEIIEHAIRASQRGLEGGGLAGAAAARTRPSPTPAGNQKSD